MVEPGATAIGLVVITGMGGVGKTSLALHAAHEVAPAFPDGQLYVDLGGFSPRKPMSGIEAISILLSALGVPASEMPSDLAVAVGRYRSLLAGKRVLLVLDNAFEARHFEPLLPSYPGSAAIVTSRRSIVAAGGREIRLDAFSEHDALAMLSRTSGRRLDDELVAAKEVVRHCGYLPLALRIVGARLATRPTWPLSAMCDRLANDRRQLDELDHHDLGVRRSLALSIEQLSNSDDELDQQAAEAILALASAPGHDVSSETAAAMLDLDHGLTESLLERLVDNALLQTHSPGRYQFHDLLRSYLRERSAEDRHGPAGLARVLRLYARAAWQASNRSWSVNERLTWYDGEILGPVMSFEDAATAAAAQWLRSERRNLAEATTLATTDHDALVAQLGIAVMPLYLDLGMHPDLISINGLALAAAERLNNVAAQGVLEHDAGAILFETGQPDKGVGRFEGALELMREAGDRVGQAMVLRNLTHVYPIVGRPDDSITAGMTCLVLLQQGGLPQRASQVYMHLGIAHARRGDTEQELNYFAKALALVEPGAAEFERRQTVCRTVALAHRRAGRLTESARLLKVSIAIAAEVSHLPNKTVGLVELARTQLALGRLDDALESACNAIQHAREAKVSSLEARALLVTGLVLQARAEPSAAELYWRRARQMYEALGLVKATEEVDQLLNASDPTSADHLFWYDGPRHPGSTPKPEPRT